MSQRHLPLSNGRGASGSPYSRASAGSARSSLNPVERRLSFISVFAQDGAWLQLLTDPIKSLIFRFLGGDAEMYRAGFREIHTDKAVLRLVCKDFKRQIDENESFEFYFDENLVDEPGTHAQTDGPVPGGDEPPVDPDITIDDVIRELTRHHHVKIFAGIFETYARFSSFVKKSKSLPKGLLFELTLRMDIPAVVLVHLLKTFNTSYLNFRMPEATDHSSTASPILAVNTSSIDRGLTVPSIGPAHPAPHAKQAAIAKARPGPGTGPLDESGGGLMDSMAAPTRPSSAGAGGLVGSRQGSVRESVIRSGPGSKKEKGGCPDLGPPDLSPRVTALEEVVVSEGLTDDVLSWLVACSPQLQVLQLTSCRALKTISITSNSLTTLSFCSVAALTDQALKSVMLGCPVLTSLAISKCPGYLINFACPKLESLAINHSRGLNDHVVTSWFSQKYLPKLRRLDISGCKSLSIPLIASPTLEEAWLSNCPQLGDEAASKMVSMCPSLVYMNLLQSIIDTPMMASLSLKTVILATCQKITDVAVSHLLKHCPELRYMDLGHCCQILEPTFEHAKLETVLLTFCVNLRERAVQQLLTSCPKLMYVELAVCMFDMSKYAFYKPDCEVVVNFDFGKLPPDSNPVN